MKAFIFKGIVVSTVVLLTSCASIFTKTKYPVNFTSDPTEALVKIKDGNGVSLFSGKTPATVTLSSGKGFFSKATYIIEFSKEGYETTVVPLTATVEGWYFGNLLLGGVLGMLIIDPATGAMWKLDENVNVNLSPLAGGFTPLQVMDINNVPEDLKDRLVAIR